VTLTHQPNTELEYWQALEGYEKTALKLRDGLRRGLIPRAEISDTKQTIEQADTALTALFLELERRFNIFCYKNHPQGTAQPKGTQKLIDWWNKMDHLAQQQIIVGDVATNQKKTP
jgi:hypothetical protein